MKNTTKLISLILSIFLLLSFSSCSLLSEEKVDDILSSALSLIEEERLEREKLFEENKETESYEEDIEEDKTSLEEDDNFSEEEILKKEEVGEGETLTIQFIDVGQADAALVECAGEYMLIDGGNRGDSDILYSILKRKEIAHLDYIVGTHAHEDHIGGIPGALEACDSVGTVFSPVTEYDSKTFENFVKAAEEKGNGLKIPKVGDEFRLGSAFVEILGPVKECEETNNTSIVLKITFGETSFLFTGDMEHDAEIDLLDSGADVSADVLKVGHHGSETSTCYRFLREVAPRYGVISVGEDNSYGHPHEEPLSRLKDAEVEVFRTDEVGDIFCTSDGKNIVFETKKF